MKNYTRILSILFLALLTILMPATAQTVDNKNKAVVETTDGTQQLNTDEISIIRFDGDKITIVQPWGNTTFDRTLRSLTFLRPLPGTLRLTVNAGINENKSNRAQAIDGDGKLRATWGNTDKVYVYADATSTTIIGELTPTTTASNSSTLSGDIDATGLTDGQELYFSTKPRPFNFASQNGTVESLFYFTASGNVTVDGGNASLSGTLNFTRPFAVVKFSLKDGVGNAINVNSLTISAASNKLVEVSSTYGDITVTPASATNELFVALRNENATADTYTLTADGGGFSYVYNKSSVSFAYNNFYAIGVNMSSPLTAGNITVITGQQGSDAPEGSGYDKLLDGDKSKKWCSLTNGGYYSPPGRDWVMWKTSESVVMTGYILTTADDTKTYSGRNWNSWTVYGGNFDDDGKAQDASSDQWTVIHQVVGDNVLEAENTKDYYYFMDNTTAYQYYKVVVDYIKDNTNSVQQMGELTMLTKNAAPNPALFNPLTFEAKADGFTVTLTSNMASLPSLEYSIDGGAWKTYTCNTATPSINTGHTIAFRGNNTGLSDGTHKSTFECSQDCYLYGNIMSLLSADSYVTARSVGEYAFEQLFAANTYIYSHDTKDLLLPATTLANSCYASMFANCSNLTKAPALPATTLARHCYNYMFAYCRELNSVTCLATDISAENCTGYWLDHVAGTGTFTAASSSVAWSEGINGIPSGWTRVNILY